MRTRIAFLEATFYALILGFSIAIVVLLTTVDTYGQLLIANRQDIVIFNNLISDERDNSPAIMEYFFPTEGIDGCDSTSCEIFQDSIPQTE